MTAAIFPDFPVALGTAQLGMPYGVANRTGQPSEAVAIAILQAAYDGGVRVFDTAQAYGSSEALIGRFLRSNSVCRDVVVITKLAPSLATVSADAIRRAIDNSLARLGVPTLSAVLLHREEQLGEWPGPLGETLLSLQAEGLIQRLGISVYTPEVAQQALAHPDLTVVEVPANVFDRRAIRAGIACAAATCGKTLLVRSVFLQGLAVMPPTDVPRGIPHGAAAAAAFARFAAEHGFDRAEFAFDYVRARLPGASFVIGAETVAQAHRNATLAWRPPLPPPWLAEWDRVWPHYLRELVTPFLWQR